MNIVFKVSDNVKNKMIKYYDDKKKEASVREKGEEESTEKEAH